MHNLTSAFVFDIFYCFLFFVGIFENNSRILYNLDFKDFTQIVSPFIAHMHIADALSVDGEGIQIGCGDINFEELASCLRQYAPNAMFLPEIWQGHKNDGEGFWNALQFLEKYEF